MMKWIQEQAQIHEGTYGKPTISGQTAGEEEENDDGLAEEYGFGMGNQKQKNKKQ